MLRSEAVGRGSSGAGVEEPPPSRACQAPPSSWHPGSPKQSAVRPTPPAGTELLRVLGEASRPGAPLPFWERVQLRGIQWAAEAGSRPVGSR